jgi:outer membrane protein
MAILAHVAFAAIPLPGLGAEVTKIGVVDPQAVLEKSKAGRRALDSFKEYAAIHQKVLSSEEEELKNIEKQVTEQESALSESQKREKQAQFRAKFQAYQKRAQEANQELQVKQKELVDDYMRKVGSATRAVAERGGYTFVVDKGSEASMKIVIYYRDSLDITDQVIKEFDRQYK